MRSACRTLAILAVGCALLSGGPRPRVALAIDGATQNPANGHWYKLITSSTKVAWSACKTNAEALGGHLVTLTSVEEHDWVRANIVSSGYTWIGGTDAAVEGAWQWVSGEPWSYTNWGGVEPNDYPSSPTGEDYALMNYGSGGTWADANDNHSTYKYVVEWSGTPGPPPATDPPADPSGLDATVVVGNPIRVTWSDNSDDEEEFEVERRTDATTFSRVAELGPNSSEFEDSNTAPNTPYTYRVRAKNAAGASGYSNEDSVTSSAIAPAPKAPSLLTVLEATTGSVELHWLDNSNDEVAFEVHRRVPGGAFAVVASLPSDVGAFTDATLPPDTAFVYGVRSVNAFRASPLVEVAAATLPTLSVTALRGDLKDSPKSLKDSIKVWAEFEFLAEASDGLFDPVVEGLSVRAGTVAAPVLMSVPANMDGWKVAKGKATWKSPKGSTPKYKFEVFLETRLVKVTVTGLELSVPPTNPVRVSLGIGNDAGTDTGDWDASKPGVLKLR